MSYVSDAEVMGGIGVGDDQFEGSYLDNEMTDHSVYNYGAPLNPYLPIQNEPMGRAYAPNNFNSSNIPGSPKVGSNYKYNPLSTYDLDTNAIYTNHMKGNPRFYQESDALYGNATPNPNRNSFNVEQDYMQDSLNYQAPRGPRPPVYNMQSHHAGRENLNAHPGVPKENFCGCSICAISRSGSMSGHSFNLFLLILIIVIVIFACSQTKQNTEILREIKSMFARPA
jgi:hypothetical protein